MNIHPLITYILQKKITDRKALVKLLIGMNHKLMIESARVGFALPGNLMKLKTKATSFSTALNILLQ